MFLSTLALLNAIKSNLAARHYSQSAPDQPVILTTDASKPKLFELVDFFSTKNLELALQRLRVMDNRVCLIVPLHDDYQNSRKGNSQRSVRTTSFMLLIADRDLSLSTGRIQPTLQSPGILGLKDLVVAALTERSLAILDKNPSTGATVKFVVALEPGPGAVMQLEWEDGGKQNVVGRECWNQVFNVPQAGITWQEIGRH